MSFDTPRRADRSPGDRECPGCIERDKEIQRLRDELAASKGVSTNRRGFRWWCLLAFGLCSLALLPHPVFLLASVLDDGGNETLRILAMGFLYSVPVAQYSVVGMVMALHWRPRWQRLFCGAGVAGLFGMVAMGPYLSSDDDTWELVRTIAPLVPIAIVISSCPLLIQRALFRWTIAVRGQSIRPIPVTLSSFLLFVGMCALAIGCLRLTDLNYFDGNSAAELAAMFLMHVGGPAATTGVLFAVFLPTILQRGGCPWTTWVLRVIAIAVVTVSGPTLLCLGIWAFEPSNTSLDMEMVWFVSYYCLGVAGTAVLVGTATFLWLRLLGYQLLSTAKFENKNGRRTSV